MVSPFRNVYHRIETPEQTTERLCSIGRDKLLAWYETEKSKTYPCTYGDSGMGQAFTVAFMLADGGPSESQLRYAGESPKWAALIEAWRRMATRN